MVSGPSFGLGLAFSSGSQEENTSINTKKINVSNIKECEKYFKKDNKNSSFIYSWHRADSLGNFGKGIIYENYIDSQSSKIFENFRIKKSKFNSLLFPVWNTFSISLINFIFFYFNNFEKKEKKEDFLKVIFPFYGKENYFNFFGKKGFLEIQLLISHDNIKQFLDEFKKLYKIYKPTSYHQTLSKLSTKNI